MRGAAIGNFSKKAQRLITNVVADYNFKRLCIVNRPTLADLQQANSSDIVIISADLYDTHLQKLLEIREKKKWFVITPPDIHKSPSKEHPEFIFFPLEDLEKQLKKFVKMKQ